LNTFQRIGWVGDGVITGRGHDNALIEEGLYRMHGRRALLAQAVGFYLKYLTVACDMEGIHSMRELLASVKEQVQSGIAHNTYNYLIMDVFNRGLPWIETNLEIDMGGTVIQEMHPEILTLEDPYAQTVGDYMQVILQQNEYGDGATDSMLIYRGTGCSREQLARYFQEINRTLEELILRKDADLNC
jgi:hypothetical protein